MRKDLQSLSMLVFRLNWSQRLVFALILTAIAATIKYGLENEISLSICYLIPIAFSAWFCNKASAYTLSILIVVSELLITLSSSHSSSSMLPYWQASNNLLWFLFVSWVITSEHNHTIHEAEIEHLCSITGLVNQHGFDEQSEKTLMLAARHSRPTIVAYIVLEQFDEMNERFGQGVTDYILHTIGEYFNQTMRRTDLVGHISQGQFALILPETDALGAKTKMGKLRNELELKAKKFSWPIHFHIGVTSFDAPPHNTHEALNIARQLMSKIKQNQAPRFTIQHYPIGA